MSNKLKILITSGIFPPDIGGPASYVPKIAGELSSHGHEVDVVCLTEDLHHDDHGKYSFKVHRIKRGLFKPWRVLKTIHKIYSLAKSKDIVFANTLSLESSMGAIMARKPIIHKIVGDYAWERLSSTGRFNGTIEEFQKTEGLIFSFYRLLMNKLPLINSDAIIAPSNFTKRMIKNWGISNNKIHVIYNSISKYEDNSKDFKKISLNNPKKKIITIGRLIPLKGIIELISVVKNLDINLLIVGSGPLETTIINYIRELKLGNRIQIIPNTENKEIHKLLKESDIFILNSYGENFPNVILEAMINNVPVICTNVGGCPEIVENRVTGLIIPPREKEKLRSAIQLMIEDSELSDTLRYNAYQNVIMNFNFQKMYNRTENLFQNIVKY